MSSLLALGGARSGKSAFAQVWAEERSPSRHYLATAWNDPADADMQARISRHRADRAQRGWSTVEVGADLAGAIAGCPAGVVLVDCITLWLSGRCLAHDWNETAVLAEVDAVCAALGQATVDIALVSNEVGSGVVPEHAWGRAFRDVQGWANQRLARAADRVVLCVAGLPVEVKPCAR